MVFLGATCMAMAGAAVLAGIVSHAAAPVPGASVTVLGNDRTLSTTSDRRGRFSFPALPLGTYEVRAAAGSLRAIVRVDLGNAGAQITLAMAPLSEIAHTVVTRSTTSAGSGSDVVLDSTDLTRLPFDNKLSEMEIQIPGAARGADGVVHINGDHGVIDYVLDGVPLPQELNRDIGAEIDINDLSFVDVIEGAYPAQYGLKFGSVLNMATRAGIGQAGTDGYLSVGSYRNAQTTLGYHAPLAGGGGLDAAVSALSTTRGLDPPNFNSPHNDARSLDDLARFTIPAGGNDFTNVTLLNSHSTFQIPNDVANGEPSATDDNESQADTWLSIQFHHTLRNGGVIELGPAYKASSIADFGDPYNDWLYGERLNVEAPPYGNGGQRTDCANAFTVAPSSPSAFPLMCGYSLADRRTALDYIGQAEYAQSAGAHTIGAGVSYDLSRVLKYYAIALQPNNFLSPIETPSSPHAPITVTDDDPNIGGTYTSYVQDTWRIDARWQADYGIRYDFFTIKSAQFAQGFGAFSPRLKLTRFLGPRASIYGYIGRFFEPFSFENVSPSAAYLLNLPLERSQTQFDLKPERDTMLEIGGHIAVGSGDLGWRVWQKNANDLIDDTQVGLTLLHQDINYVLGRISQEAVNYVRPLQFGGRAYLSVAHVVSLNSGCETQLLAPCFGLPNGYTPADHEQRYSVAGGLLFDDRRGGWFSADAEYGSGLSSAICPSGTPGYCKQTPHTVFNAERGIALSAKTAIVLDAQNIFNDRYFVTLLNAQGNHYAGPRAFDLGVRFKP